ncbi:toll/interleukin-1 receptor domain-containing protein [Actinomyces slackii]|uniref:TIR domain-containing protein n=1 Tax=Actinomyces slackii TaxID=52774 RepID=A0A448KEV2_9ACTO|nr:toll/interleukin-1 receptor domain-containing protein [Actinomyces slackii]VEG75484.1 Uncharacterised protein [Actinomyces slackii]
MKKNHNHSTLQIFLSFAEDTGSERAIDIQEIFEGVGINIIVAKHDVVPGTQWDDGIESFLDSSDALICLGTPGFSQRAWCQQEVGWALARRLPIFWISYDVKELPCGLLAGTQAHTSQPSDSAEDDVQAIAEWCFRLEPLRDPLTQHLITSLASSSSFDESDSIVSLLAQASSLEKQNWERIISIAANNEQFGRAHRYVHHGWGWQSQPLLVDWLKEQIDGKPEHVRKPKRKSNTMKGPPRVK